MKDQYFGDINDYRKYGLLRVLADEGSLRTGVCWMLTAPDGRTDGLFLRYLSEPGKWRAYDPELFDCLARCVREREDRNVRCIEEADTLPRTLFHTDLLTDNAVQRTDYFDDALTHFREADLIFFDPDNGMEVKSRPWGRKSSCKYLYWRELTLSYASGHSVLIYQHFTRERRDAFIPRLVSGIRTRTKATEVLSFRTPNVVFF